MKTVDLSQVRVEAVYAGPPSSHQGPEELSCVLCLEGVSSEAVWSLHVTPAGEARPTAVPVCAPCGDAYRWYVDWRETPGRSRPHRHAWF